MSNNQALQAELSKRLNDVEYQKKQLIDDFKQSKTVLKDYTRRTQFANAEEEEVEELVLKQEDLVESKPMKVIVKKDLQVFRMGIKAFENNIDKYENDDIAAIVDASTTDYVVIATKSGQSITRFVNDLEQGSLNDNYEQLNKQIPDLVVSDEFVGAISSNDYKTHRMVILTKMVLLKS